MSPSGTERKGRFARDAEATARSDRAIQRRVDRTPPTKPKSKRTRGMQAGARPYPAPPFP